MTCSPTMKNAARPLRAPWRLSMQRNVQRAARLAGGTDPWLLIAFLGLASIGLLMVYSASIADAYNYYGTATYVFYREIVWVALGLVTLFFVTRIDYHRYQSWSLLFMG